MADTLYGSYHYYDSYHLYGSYYIWWLLASIAMLATISTADTLYGSYCLYGCDPFSIIVMHLEGLTLIERPTQRQLQNGLSHIIDLDQIGHSSSGFLIRPLQRKAALPNENATVLG